MRGVNLVDQQSGSKANYDAAGREALRQFPIAHVRHDLNYLASDSLEGRETCEPGQIKAADFIARQFKEFGLKPIGDDGSYLQHFNVDLHYISDSSFVEAGGKYFQNGSDVVVPPFGAADTTLTAQAVFAGYGFEDGTYSDYQGLNVKGRIVVIMSGNPAFADTNDIMIRTALYKRSNAVRHGAAAVLIVMRGGDKEVARIVQQFGSLFGNKTMKLASPAKEARIPATTQVLYIRNKVADQMMKAANTDVETVAARIDSLKSPASMQLGEVTVCVKIVSETRQTENVIGMLEGTDPSLKDQYVVYSAHYDHLGKTATGVVYHGADDNASGTSTVLGIAELYSKMQTRPRRSIIFLTVTGEEKGLLGSDYFTSHPTVPMTNIVTDLNTDMDGRIDTSYVNRDSNYVFVIGSSRLSKNLDSLLVAADSQSVGLKLDYSFDSDNDPNQFYYRSDHYNFAKKNVPVIFFFDGNHPDYHKPTDTSDKITFPILEKRAKLIFLTGWKVANLDWRLRPN